MDSSDEGKLFIGGIAWDTTEETLRDYFGRYGAVSQVAIMRDKVTGRPRGFGFVLLSDPSAVDRVLEDSHTIDGRTVEAKRALSREEQQTSSRPGNVNAGTASSGGGGNIRTKKIFVGGLPSTLTEDGFREYFENYGHVTDVVIMFDQQTQRPRGFGFITFDIEDAVDRVLHKTFHELNGKHVEVKRALPKDAIPAGGGHGGGHQNYGSSGSIRNATDGRTDGDRNVQSHTSTGGYPPYSGNGEPSYCSYGVQTTVGYAGYGGYNSGGYGSGGNGFGGPTGFYGMPGGLRSTWGPQTPGYGAAYYGANTGYGPSVQWGVAGGTNSASLSMGQSQDGCSGFGNRGYGYDSYGGSDGPYSAGYGGSGGHAGNAPYSFGGSGADKGERQGNGVGYHGGGGSNSYSNSNGTAGYASEAWRFDSSQASGNYGSGYVDVGSHRSQASQ